MTYNPPPNWPQPPQGWEPPPGWQPDPAWGPAPQGWNFSTPAHAVGKKPRGRQVSLIIVALAVVGIAIGAGFSIHGTTSNSYSSNDEPGAIGAPATLTPSEVFASALAADGGAPTFEPDPGLPLPGDTGSSSDDGDDADSPSPEPAATHVNGDLQLSDKGFTLSHIKLSADAAGDEEATATLTNDNSDTETATFELTVKDDDGNILATVSGSVNNLEAGSSNTVDLLSSDRVVTGTHQIYFQVDANFGD